MKKPQEEFEQASQSFQLVHSCGLYTFVIADHTVQTTRYHSERPSSKIEAQMAGPLNFIAQTAELRVQLRHYANTLEALGLKHGSLVQRFQALPIVIRESAEISEQDRAVCAIELWPTHPSRQLPYLFDWHSQAATSIQAALDARNLADAAWGLGTVDQNVIVVRDYLGHIEAAVSAHEKVQKVAMLCDQLILLIDCLDGFAKTHSHLRDRYQALHPSIQDSPLVRVYSRTICDDEFGETPLEQSHLATTMERLSNTAKTGYGALISGHVEDAERALKAADEPVPSIDAQLRGLEAAIDEHVRAQDFAAVQAERACYVHTGKDTIIPIPSRR